MTTVNGGEDGARPSRERVRDTRGREGRGAGGAGRRRGASGGGGVEEAGRELATAIARAATRLCLLAEVEGDRFALVGWASATVLGQLGCQVSAK